MCFAQKDGKYREIKGTKIGRFYLYLRSKKWAELQCVEDGTLKTTYSSKEHLYSKNIKQYIVPHLESIKIEILNTLKGERHLRRK